MSRLRASSSVTLTKWYVDALCDDGTVLLVYLGVVRAAGVQLARATATLFPPHGQAISDRSPTHDAALGDATAQVGTFRFDARTLTFSTPRLTGTLRYQPRANSVTLLDPFLDVGAHSLRWTIEVPDADVEGSLTVDGAPRALRARGYRDRVTTDIRPWRFPIRTLEWGRAFGGPHRASWVDATLHDGTHRAASFVDDDVRVGVQGVPPEVVLDEGRVLLAGRVTSSASLALGPLRSLGRLVYGDPQQQKHAGRAVVRGAAGQGVWETVRFGARP